MERILSKNKKLQKQYHRKFKIQGSDARTLPVEYVSDGESFIGKNYQRTHDSGWTISGKVIEDRYLWVNEFQASHPVFGFVSGDFEKEIVASSKEAFDHFAKNHPYEEWDYGDI